MYINPHRSARGASGRGLIGRSHAERVRRLLACCPAYRPTPLVGLRELADVGGIGAVYLKDESDRMALGSFKALGGAFAVAELVRQHAIVRLGREPGVEELRSPEVAALGNELTLICASAGNHGLAVAAGARVFGPRAVVVLSETVPESFAARLREQGADVVFHGSNYEQSMAYASETAGDRGWILVSDSSWPGYTTQALSIMRGYTILLEEAASELEASGGPATHVFIQAGVGGLAAAAASYLRERWGEAFRFIVVEPDGAPCLLESVRNGRFTRVSGGPTSLGRLDCKEPSIVALEILSCAADAFHAISDAQADEAAARLSSLGLSISPCGAAGLAGLLRCASDADAKAALELGPASRVLLVGTESDAGLAASRRAAPERA